MTRIFILTAAILSFVVAGTPGAQERPSTNAQGASSGVEGRGRGGRGAAEGITRGADQPNQNKWNAKGPWGKTERSGPLEAQRKDPFKLFDNVHYVGLETVSAFLVTTSAGPVLVDSGYAQTVDWLIDSIRKSGVDPATIEYVFVTHSHLDHAGGGARPKAA